MTLKHSTRGALSGTRASSLGRHWAAMSVAVVLAAAIVSGTLTASAATRRARKANKPAAAASRANAVSKKGGGQKKAGEYNPAHESVELFEAVKKGDLEVKLIPKDSTQGRVFIENKTKKPLNVKLPAAFAAVPVLAQMGGGGGQGMGGGMGGGGMGMGGGGGGFFNVAAEKKADFKVTTVCLEHGKPEPRAAMAYKLVPIDQFTEKAGVKELCTLLGNGKISQRAAQAAAWHLNNDMSWEVLFAKQINHLDGVSEPYFTPAELQAGIEVARLATSMVEEQPAEKPTASLAETAGGN